MDISAPIVNRLMPNTRKVAPIKKRTISPAEIVVSVIDRTRTIISIGNTDFSDSVRLCLMRFIFTPFYRLLFNRKKDDVEVTHST